jgi:hypothetical protein
LLHTLLLLLLVDVVVFGLEVLQQQVKVVSGVEQLEGVGANLDNIT